MILHAGLPTSEGLEEGKGKCRAAAMPNDILADQKNALCSRKKYGHCHCSQLKANGRDRVNGRCIIGCFYEGFQYPFSQCSICLCTCDAFVNLGQYHAIVSVTTVPTVQIRNEDARASARSWLEGSMNVNRVQTHSSAAFYAHSKQSGEIASYSMLARNIENDASLAQSLYMVGNATYEHGTLWALRSQVNGVQHPAGSSFTQYGDMNEHGRTTSADLRHTNNGLEGHPHAYLLYDLTSNKRPMLGSAQSNSSRSNERETMAEEEMITSAIAQSFQA